MSIQNQDFETVIGLEVHVQLNTKSKIFCADDTTFGSEPNTQVSPLSLAHPGTLPRLNGEVLRKAVQLGMALGCEISRFSSFDRKNYFYADLPKGYQITQDSHPICRRGEVKIKLPDGSRRAVRLHHIHLEEDAGKSIHDQQPHFSLIDLNRAGTPLLEIVSEPDLHSPDEAAAFMDSLRRTVRWLDVSDGNMEQGSLRCDVNVSVRRHGDQKLGQRCEVKNVNSMRFARRAIEFEVARQISILKKGGKVAQETRGFDPATGETFSLREKEDAHDYRYFPEPDLPPVRLSEDFLNEIRDALPELPEQMEQSFTEHFHLPAKDVDVLCADRPTAVFFLKITALAGGKMSRVVANFVINRLKPRLEETGKSLSDCPLSARQIVDYLQLVESERVSATTAAQKLLPALLETPAADVQRLAAELNLFQTSDAVILEKLVDEVLTSMPEKVAEFRRGKKGLIGLFVGEVMKRSGGKADPKLTNSLILKKI